MQELLHGSWYDAIETSMENLTPYSPITVSKLVITFKEDNAS